MIGIPIAPRAVEDFVARHGGALRNGVHGTVRRIVPIATAAAGDLAPLFAARYVEDAARAVARGAILLVDEALAIREDVAGLPGWFHAHAAWTLADVLDVADAPAQDPIIGERCSIGPGAILMPRVVLGARVTIGPGAIIGAPGFGFATGPGGRTREIPQLGGVLIEDDVHIGALSTIASGTIGPTILRRGVKLDAQVHVGHNAVIGEGTMIAAQTGLAGSVVIGRGVMMGGQVGVADHVTIGDGAQIAAKSGVIGDVAPGSTVAGYPAVERHRWLRGLAELYRLAASRANSTAPEAPSSSTFPSAFAATPGSRSLTPRPPAPGTPIPPPAAMPIGINPAAIIRRNVSSPPREGS